MATEILDIVDTAVKIGLGALISGITTYAVTNKNQRHEIEKSAITEKTILLREAVLNFEECAANMQHTYISYINYLHDNETQDIDEIVKEITNSGNLAKRARTSFLLIGNVKLGNLAEQYWEYIDNLRLSIHDQDIEADNEIIDSMNSIKTDFLALLPSALDEISA